MKGLLIKDFKLLKSQKKFLMIIFIIDIILSIFYDDVSFSIGYLGFIGAFFSVNTIGYDENDNGYAFIFSLPITRKDYVKEKYGFGIILGSLFWMMSFLIALLTQFFCNTLVINDLVNIALIIAPIVFMGLFVAIPIYLKFGIKQSATVFFALVGSICFLIYFIRMMFDMSFLIDTINSLNGFTLLMIFVVLDIVIMIISYNLSMFIINKKEF